MKSWMLPWLLPVGMLGAVVLPLVLRAHFRSDRDDRDADVHYWRLGSR